MQDGPFWGCSRIGGSKKPPPPFLKSVTHTCNDKTWHSIPYLKKTQKIYESRDTPLELC